MSTDWREKEREFLTSLKADTGRDLGEWMRVIAAQNLPHRNHIIDWLRQQGFIFARASWLERIHHNQGRPIYLDLADLMPHATDSQAEAEAEADAEIEGGMQRVAAAGSRGAAFICAPSTTPATLQQPPVPARTNPARTMPPPRIAAPALHSAAAQYEAEVVNASDVVNATDDVARRKAADAPSNPRSPHDPAGAQQALYPQSSIPEARPPSPTLPEAAPSGGAIGPPARRLETRIPALAIDDVLAKAKAYRPLAMHLMRMIEGALASLKITPGPGYLLLSVSSTPFALMAVSGKDIRLALRLPDGVACAHPRPIKLPVTLARAAQGMTHMAVLTDARQIDDELINLVRRAAHG